MHSAWGFPTSLEVGGREYEIRTDFRAVLDLLTALNDRELMDNDPSVNALIQSQLILQIMYPAYKEIPEGCAEEAIRKASEFIDMGMSSGESSKPKLMDWDKDAPVIVPAINKVLGKEIRAEGYIHWWTFLGAYLEITESLFSSIVSIRAKKTKGTKLEKWELEFYKSNKDLIDLDNQEKRSEEEKEMLREYFGFRKKR